MRKLLYTLLAFLVLVSISAEAQEAKKGLIHIWSDFSGGLVSKASPIGLKSKYGTICQNVRLDTEHKTLSKRPEIFSYGTADLSEAITGIFRHYQKDGTKTLIVCHGNEVESGNDQTGAFTNILDLTTADYRFQAVSWHDLLILCDGYNQPIKTDGTDATFIGSCFAEDNGAGAGPNGTYTYKVSFYTSSYEVIFDVESNSVTVTDNDIDLSMIPIGPDTYLGESITGRKVYRNTVADQNTWKLLTNGTIANNTATTLTDSDADGALGAAYPAGDATWTPPKGKFCVVHNNRLFFLNDPTTATDTGPSTAYYSKNGSHDLFENTDYFNIRKNDGDEITFGKNLLGRLCIGKTGTIQYLNTDGDDPAQDWSISDPYSFVGCTAPYSAKNTPLGIFYMSWDGLYVFNGQISKLLSDAITPTIEDISKTYWNNMWGEFHKNKFYLAYTKEGGDHNNRCLIYDLITKGFSVDIIDINCFAVLGGSDDWGDLYAGSSSDGEVYTYTQSSTLNVIHSAHSDFTGTWDDMGYIPTGAAGGDANEAILELRENTTIDNMAGTIDAATGDIDRPDTGGTYISPVIYMPGISAYNTLYWNETLPVGNDVYFQLRGGTTSANCTGAAWDATQYTSPTGSDISGEIGGTAYEYTQYRITMSTDDIDETPQIYYGAGYAIKFSYDLQADDMESTIDFEWESGWQDFGYPGYKKTLRKLYCWHEGTSGTLTLTFSTFQGDTDIFNIDLSTDQTYYTERFTDGALIGDYIKLNISNSDVSALKIKRIVCVFDIEPLV